jgi:hypothetical protein
MHHQVIDYRRGLKAKINQIASTNNKRTTRMSLNLLLRGDMLWVSFDGEKEKPVERIWLSLRPNNYKLFNSQARFFFTRASGRVWTWEPKALSFEERVAAKSCQLSDSGGVTRHTVCVCVWREGGGGGRCSKMNF